MWRRILQFFTRSLVCDAGLYWVEPERLAGSAYPRREAAFADLSYQHVTVLVNLDTRAHNQAVLARFGLREIHIPVRDFTAPRPEQIEQGIMTIHQAIASGQRVVVHCGGGRGRTGTLLACYLVHQGMQHHDAVRSIRKLRPGAIETRAQHWAVESYATRHMTS